MDRRRLLAREWLLFLGCFVAGVAIVPPLLAVAFTHDDFRLSLAVFYKALFFRRGDWLISWLLAFAPYTLLQIARSVVWAVRVLRKANSPTV